jgi:hypothetical protein
MFLQVLAAAKWVAESPAQEHLETSAKEPPQPPRAKAQANVAAKAFAQTSKAPRAAQAPAQKFFQCSITWPGF